VEERDKMTAIHLLTLGFVPVSRENTFFFWRRQERKKKVFTRKKREEESKQNQRQGIRRVLMKK